MGVILVGSVRSLCAKPPPIYAHICAYAHWHTHTEPQLYLPRFQYFLVVFLVFSFQPSILDFSVLSIKEFSEDHPSFPVSDLTHLTPLFIPPSASSPNPFWNPYSSCCHKFVASTSNNDIARSLFNTLEFTAALLDVMGWEGTGWSLTKH